MPTKLDIRQSELRSALGMVGSAANDTVDTILTKIDPELAKLFEDRNILLTDGGLITFTGTAVQFTENLNLVINQKISGAAPQTISLGSATQTLANGDVWYATVNRTAGTATTAVASTLPAVTSANQEIFLIAKRSDAGGGVQRLYFRSGVAFDSGQTSRLGATGSQFVLKSGDTMTGTLVVSNNANGGLEIRTASGSAGFLISRTGSSAGSFYLGTAGDRDGANTFDEIQFRKGVGTSTAFNMRATDAGVQTLFFGSGTDAYISRSGSGEIGFYTSGGLRGGFYSDGTFRLYGGTSGYTGFQAASSTTSYNLTLPDAQGGEDTTLSNNGSGTLSWVALTSARNGLVNSDFLFWQRSGASAVAVANGGSVYGPDQWYGVNGLGGGSQITLSRIAGASGTSRYACQVQITTAPTSAQANGCELRQTLENLEAIQYYNKTASFTVKIKALGNVNQVGVQFMYKTTEAKVDTAIGSEVLTTVNTGGFVNCTINGQALGTSQTTSGVIGIRIRITGVSTGNTYDVNNGFICEQAQLNLGGRAATYSRQSPSLSEELVTCQRFYRKSYDLEVTPGAVSLGSTVNGMADSTTQVGGYHWGRDMRIAPTIVPYNPSTGTINQIYRHIDAAAITVNSIVNVGKAGFQAFNTATTTVVTHGFHYTANAEI